MDGSRNMTIDFENKRCYILYIGIHGGNGMGSSYPYNGRYYLVSPDFWKKEKENYCMVHDSVLPKAWDYYEKNGIFLLEENKYPGKVTKEVLITFISRLEPELLELLELENTNGEASL